MLSSVLAISAGASLGALLRWVLGLQLNSILPTIPPGTLAANLLGGYLIGIAVTFFAAHPAIAPEWRLLAITGFLGGFTTFSTFSAEVVEQLMAGRMGWALAAIAVHVLGSLAMALLGMLTASFIRSSRLPGG